MVPVPALLVAGTTVLAGAGATVLALVDEVRPGVAGPVAGMAFGLTGALVATRRPGSVVARLLLVVGLSLSSSAFLQEWARHALVADPGSLPFAHAALWIGAWAWVPGYCTLAALLPLRLPDGDPPAGLRRLGWWAALAVTALASLAWAVTPYDRMDRPPVEGLPPGTTSPAGLDAGPVLLALTLPLLAVCALGAVASLLLRLRSAVGEERQQLKWVVYGGALTVGLLGVGQVAGPEGGSDLLLALAALPLPAGTAVAALRYRLWDVDRVIDRTAAYAVLTGLVVLLYAGVVLVLGDLLGRRTGAPLVATVAVALGAEPVRRRVQALVDGLRGDRSDPYAALVRLGRRLEDAAAAPVGPQALAGVADAVASALQLPWVVVDVLDGPITTSGTPAGEGVRVPLVHAGELVGELQVGPRRAGRPLSAGDLRLLDDLARHVAVAAHAVHLREALQRSRERLVTAREEERRRLRRDLHDDLGPLLAAVALHLGEVRDLAPRDGRAAADLASRAERLLTGAVATVRHLVEDLRPAALDELGLAGSLRTLTDGFGAAGLEVALEVDGELEGLPAAVEVAALRVATEAVHNAVRHSGARRVRLGVQRLGGVLEVTVADDGRGLPDVPRAGVGLGSMRERAEELGGTCSVASQPAGGTAVMVRLPLQPGRDRREPAPW